MASEEEPQFKASTVRLPVELWVRFRVILLRERKTMQEVFEDYVRRYVEAKENKQ